MMDLISRTTTLNGKTFSLWEYSPSIPAAAVFIVLFALTTGFHIFQASKKRTFYFIPLIIGGLFEVIGYVGRILAYYNQDSLGIYILQSVTLLVAPALFSASIYMILGRVIVLTQSEAYSPIRSRFLTKIFVCGDVLSFLVQSGGGGMMAKSSTQNLGKYLVLIGLFIQVIFFGCFMVCSGLVHMRLNRNPTASSMQSRWTKHMYMLYIAGVLILIRSLFRVAEFANGRSGPIQSHEFYLYIFDSILMLGVMVGFNIVHPGEIIGRRPQGEGFQLSPQDISSEALAYERK
ncbi:RTA1 like protein-domain-containing protein [Calycina marina]|uniref:RTA1 like protein-domain-containing protein n=1 Tax=Calycina marina TaxID=1763456 RepID=A0A9P7Z2A4_9HELO|nr:RTA1 like protein-domain-containing protein [Calycina marina]